jgi:hypothetical protein
MSELLAADKTLSEEKRLTAEEWHKHQAIHLFNEVWNYIEKHERTQEEIDYMIHASHASRHHWGKVGKPVNFARGEWQISRVYAVVGRHEPALFHGTRCLEICEEHGIGDFDIAFAYEAIARAHAVAGNEPEMARYLELGHGAGMKIIEKDDRDYFLSDLDTVERALR